MAATALKKSAAKKEPRTGASAAKSPAKKSKVKQPKAKQPLAKEAGVQQPTELIRDRISLPEADYDLIKALKGRAKSAGAGSVKKRDIIRAALRALHDSGAAELLRILKGLPPISKKPPSAK